MTIPHTLPGEQVLASLGTGTSGLTTADAQRRLAEAGPNELAQAERVSPWRILLDQFKNVLILILLGATVLSVFLGHGLESLVIAVIVLFAVLLGFVQEYRAERAIEALRSMTAPVATAIRDGEEVKIPARDLVPGDIILLHTGDRVPADARVLDSVNLKAEEAALTGESVAVDKHTRPLEDATLGPGDRRNMVFSGTSVAYGRGRAVVTGTGMKSEFGKIAELLQTVETTRTPLQKNLDRVGSVLARVALVVVAVIVAVGLFRGQPFIEMFIFGIALAVAVVPEALPAVVTISLALGVQKMARRNALMRRLPAVETLGSTAVICTDKTGTLTKDEMTVRALWVGGRTVEVSGSGYQPEGELSAGGAPVEPDEVIRRMARAGVLCSDAVLLPPSKDRPGWSIKGDPTEAALVVVAAKVGLDRAALEQNAPRTGEIPFAAETRRMTTLHGDGMAYAKGAPEVLLDACSTVLTADGPVPLDAERKGEVLAAAQAMAERAMRVLAVMDKATTTLEEPDRGFTLLGLAGMIDPPRPEVYDAVATCRTAGIRAVMITGDHPATARAIARELNLLAHDRVVTGQELDRWDDTTLDREVEGVEVFARVSPAHKLKVVSALQARGHVVAMTGDGVNDAPALRKADIGIAMGITGTDVSREAAAMTLTDDSFASIVAAVEEGRRVFGNIKKYLMYLLSSNIGEVGLVAGTALLGLPLPLTAVQLLYVNLATDGLPALALAVDPPDPDVMKQAPRDARQGIFTRSVVTLMLVGGVWSTVVNVSLFAWALGSGRPTTEAITMTFVSLVLIQFFKAYNYRSDIHSVIHRPFANKWLNLSVIWELALLMLIVYLPALQGLFTTFALTTEDWVVVLLASVSIVPVLEIAKALQRHGFLGAGRRDAPVSPGQPA